jgi:membrane-bound lytic murein transglycosylase F
MKMFILLFNKVFHLSRFDNYLSRHLVLLLATSLSLSLFACSKTSEESQDLLAKIKAKGELLVLTTNEPTTYYIGREGEPEGPEYDMAVSLAQALDVKVKFLIMDSVAEVIESLRKGEGDLAAAGLTITDKRKEEFEFGPAYTDVSEYLVCHRKTPRIKNRNQLKDLEIIIPAETSYINTLSEKFPEVKFTLDNEQLTPELLDQVSTKKIQCTVSDSTIFDISRRYHPEITKRYTLSKGSQLAFMYVKDNLDFSQSLKTWFSSYKSSGALAQKIEKYYGYIDTFDYVDIVKFKRRINQRLPKYKKQFIEASQQNDLAPSLLAAQSYQESHWNPKAKSPTGVRGIMMLTQPVAKSLGVTSRLDATQNIFAGAKFQAKMKAMFDEDVTEPDRSWMALAAYNVGRGHFRDAQRLAKKLGKNPKSWLDMKKVLPLLSNKKYYQDLKYGYARGGEPVQYVRRIRDYEDILLDHFKK